MSIKLIKSPCDKEFKDIFLVAKKEIIISSPYINIGGVDLMLNSINEPNKKSINILTNLSSQNIIDNVTQPSALLSIYESFNTTTVTNLSKLHAKIYIIDNSLALISSANLTFGGLKSNFEYGVLIDEKDKVNIIKKDVLDYASVGYVFDKKIIGKLQKLTKDLEPQQSAIKKDSTVSEIKRILKHQQEITETIASQYNNKETRHGIFAKTIDYLLHKNSELTTTEIYKLVQDIHPELCNDDVKYSNGEKKWKIEVRQSRFFLQKKGVVINVPNKLHSWKLA